MAKLKTEWSYMLVNLDRSRTKNWSCLLFMYFYSIKNTSKTISSHWSSLNRANTIILYNNICIFHGPNNEAEINSKVGWSRIKGGCTSKQSLFTKQNKSLQEILTRAWWDWRAITLYLLLLCRVTVPRRFVSIILTLTTHITQRHDIRTSTTMTYSN